MNNKFVVGSIPTKVVYVFANEVSEKIGCEFDKNKIVKGRITHTADANDKYDYNKVSALTKKITSYSTRDPIVIEDEEADNVELTDIKLLNISTSGYNGRSYKALLNNKYIIDIREDVVMDTILNNGISKNGKLKGKFIWGRQNGKNRLVRVGSEIHSLLIEYEQRKSKPVLKPDTFVVGGVYQDKRKNKYIYLGKGNTVEYIKENTPSRWMPGYTADYVFKEKPIKSIMSFLYVHNPDSIKDIQTYVDNRENLKNATLASSVKFIEQVGKVKVPKNVFEFIREESIKSIKNDILEFSGAIKPKYQFKITAMSLEYRLIQTSANIHLHGVKEETPELFDIKKYLVFA